MHYAYENGFDAIRCNFLNKFFQIACYRCFYRGTLPYILMKSVPHSVSPIHISSLERRIVQFPPYDTAGAHDDDYMSGDVLDGDDDDDVHLASVIHLSYFLAPQRFVAHCY